MAKNLVEKVTEKQLKNDMEEAEKELIKLRVLAEKIQKEMKVCDMS